MPIEFLDILADEGWVPANPDDDGRLVSTTIDPTFDLTGIRLRSEYTVGPQSHDQQVLRIVFGGSLELHADGEVSTVGAGQFCVVDADTVHSLVAGPDGVTYTESWHLGAPPATTTPVEA